MTFAIYKETLYPSAERKAETRLTILYHGIQASIRRAFMLQCKQSKVRGTHSAIHPDIDVTIDLVSKICSRPRGQHGCLYSPLRDPDCMQNKTVPLNPTNMVASLDPAETILWLPMSGSRACFVCHVLDLRDCAMV